MAIRLTLDIFSGRLNPQIVLTDDQESELLNRMRPRKERLTRKELLPAPLSILGYRGIVVEQLDRPSRGLPKSFRVANGDLIGDDFTVADLNVAAVISRAIDMDLTATPQLGAWLHRCLERPAALEARRLREAADAASPPDAIRLIARINRL